MRRRARVQYRHAHGQKAAGVEGGMQDDSWTCANAKALPTPPGSSMLPSEVRQPEASPGL